MDPHYLLMQLPLYRPSVPGHPIVGHIRRTKLPSVNPVKRLQMRIDSVLWFRLLRTYPYSDRHEPIERARDERETTAG